MTQFKPPKNSEILETRCAESAVPGDAYADYFGGYRINDSLYVEDRFKLNIGVWRPRPIAVKHAAPY